MTSVPPCSVGIVVGPVIGLPLPSPIVKVSFGSLPSLVSTLPVAGSPTVVMLASSTVSGVLSKTPIVIDAVSCWPVTGSVIVYGTWTVPTKSSSGVNVTSPVVGLTVRTPAGSPLGSRIVIGPAVGSCPATSVIVSGSFSGSVSLLSKLPVNGRFLVPIKVSSPADGLPFSLGSAGGLTTSVTVALSIAPLGSMMLYSKLSSPIKPAGGV